MKLRCINAGYLKQMDTSIYKGETNDHKPALVLNEIYPLNEILLDDKGFPHYDVGLKSTVDTIRSIHTGKFLDRGDVIHWCHPSRFEPIPEDESLEAEAIAEI